METPEVWIQGFGQVVTADEAAHLLSVERQRIHQLLHGDGARLAGIKIGATQFVSLRTVRSYKRSPRKTGRPSKPASGAAARASK